MAIALGEGFLVRSPTAMLLFFPFHLRRCCNVGKYSELQRFQNCWRNFWMYCHRDNRLSAVSTKLGSGMAFISLKIKKCAGVNALRSFGSFGIGVKGREFKIASNWANNVQSSSNDRVVVPIVRRKWYLTLLTAASHRPPRWGAYAGLKCHCICLGKISSLMEFWFCLTEPSTH